MNKSDWTDYCIFVSAQFITMKRITRFTVFLLFLIVSVLHSGAIPASPGVQENIANAIRTGNAKQLSSYFSSTVEISVPGKEGTFSKVQSEMVMKDFFAKYTPVSFIINQKGTSTGGAQFMIGTYKCENQAYKTYILLKPVDGVLLIQQIQFEME